MFNFFNKNRIDKKTLFDEISLRTKAYLQVTILKPDVLIDTGDTNFHNIDLYKLGKEIPIAKRVIFYNMIKMYFQNYANSFYVVINEKNGSQPIVFTVWDIGTEIRIGVFLNKDSILSVGIDFDEMTQEVEKRLSVFDGSSIENINKKTDRNSFYLIEKSLNISNDKYSSDDVSKFVSILFANFVANVTKFYFENRADF